MKKQSKATVKTPVKDFKKNDSIEHYNAVLLEDIKSKMEFIIKGMESANISLKKDMHHLEERLTQEMELLKGVLHKHSDDLDWSSKIREMYGNNIKENNLQITANGQKIESLKLELQHMETRLLDKISERLDDHEGRITTLEKNPTAHA